MGCDIHAFKEKYVNGNWLSADEWVTDDDYTSVTYEKRCYKGRNYDFFGLLSGGVRRNFDYSFRPRGVPFNPSQEVKEEIERWHGDGHSHSYLYLFELKQMLEFLKTNKIKISGMKDADELKALTDSIESGQPNWDLIYPYCQSANMKNYVDFEIEVPAHVFMGSCLQQIIDSFDGVEGENQRLVFFFDN